MTADTDILDALVVGAGWAGLGVSDDPGLGPAAAPRAGTRPHRRNVADAALGQFSGEPAQLRNRHARVPLWMGPSPKAS